MNSFNVTNFRLSFVFLMFSGHLALGLYLGLPLPCATSARSLPSIPLDRWTWELPQRQKTHGKRVPDVMHDFVWHKKHWTEKYTKLLITPLLPSMGMMQQTFISLCYLVPNLVNIVFFMNVTKIILTRCQIFHLKCTKFNFIFNVFSVLVVTGPSFRTIIKLAIYRCCRGAV